MSDEIAARLGLDNSALGRGLKEAKVQVKEFAEHTRESFGDIVKELAAPLSGVGLIAMGEQVFGKVEEIERTAEAAGMTAEQFQRLSYAARQVGVESDATEKSMEFLSKTIGEAGAGEKAQAELFDRWGISIRGANGQLRQAPDILDEISNQMAAMTDPASRAAMAQDLLGKSGAKMVAVLSQGAKELHARGDGAAVLTDADIEQIKQAHESIQNVENSVTVLTGKLIAGVGSFASFLGSSIGAGGYHRNEHNEQEVDYLKRQAQVMSTNARLHEEARKSAEAEKAARKKTNDDLDSQAAKILNAAQEKELSTAEKLQQVQQFIRDAKHDMLKLDKDSTAWHQSNLDLAKAESDEMELQKTRTKEIAEEQNKADQKRKSEALKRLEIERDAQQQALVKSQIEAHKDQPYYHTLRELAGNYNVRPASDIAIEARQLEQGEAELQLYTLANGVNTPEFRKRRDYLSGIQMDLEKKGYLAPELSLQKMEAHLESLTRLASGSGLNVNPSIN